MKRGEMTDELEEVKEEQPLAEEEIDSSLDRPV
jgi:hypothetical protein